VIETGETAIFVRRRGPGPRSSCCTVYRRPTWCAPASRSSAPTCGATDAAAARRVMEQMGLPRFSVAGHDRSGRVAYRMALDPSAVPLSGGGARADGRGPGLLLRRRL